MEEKDTKLTKCDRLRLTSSLVDFRTKKFYLAVAVEGLCSFFFVLIDCSSSNRNVSTTNVEAVVTRYSLCTGLTLACLIWAFQEVSGGLINPCVTLSYLVTRRISLLRAVAYFVVQTASGIFGTYTAQQLTVPGFNPKVGITMPIENFPLVKAAALEMLVTYFLVSTIYSCVDKARHDISGSRALTIGISATVVNLAFFPLTGTSMNPVRSLGPALVLGRWHAQWIYWVGPCIGAVLSGLSYDLCFSTTAGARRLLSFLRDPFYNPDSLEFHKNSSTYHTKSS